MITEQKIGDTSVRHYSDSGFMIKQIETGIEYSDAIDIFPCRFTYEETSTPIESGVDSDLEDAAQAARILLGVEK